MLVTGPEGAGPTDCTCMSDWHGNFEGRLDLQPPVTDEQLAELPARRGVGLMTTADDEPILLLPAADLRRRMANRLRDPSDEGSPKKLPDLRSVTGRVYWILAGSAFETDLLYYEMARILWPAEHTRLLAFKPAWFVHVDPAAERPRFRRTRDLYDQPGVYLGPMPTGKAAQAFVEALQDGFRLCRDARCLAQAPDAAPCTYAQLDRCLRVCDGTVSFDEYRQAVAEAARYAAGDRRPMRDRLSSEMSRAAGELAFERAGRIKTRLERLAELDGPAYADVRRGEDLRYLLLQSSGSRKRATVFLCDRGVILRGEPLEMPATEDALNRCLQWSRSIDTGPPQDQPARRWRIGLVASYLHSGRKRQGLILPTGSLSAERLAEGIEQAADVLNVRSAGDAAATPSSAAASENAT